MIRIEMHDMTAADKPLLKALSDALHNVADGMYGELAEPARTYIAAAHVHKGDMVKTISPDDRPDTGAPAASEVFGKAGTDEPNPASVFGGNGAPASAGAATSTTAPVASAAISTSTNAPLPPAAPPAPPAATAAQNTASPAELDKDGLPWDGRIHAESRAKIADQTWRRRRNITAEYYAQVVAELRGVMGNGLPASPSSQTLTALPATGAAGTSTAGSDTSAAASVTAASSVAPPPPPPSTAPAAATLAAPAAPVQDANSTGNVPPVPPPPPPTLPAASPSVQEGESQVSANFVREFPKLCKRIAEAVNSNALSNETLSAVLAKQNLPNLPTLAAFPHLVPVISEALGFTE